MTELRPVAMELGRADGTNLALLVADSEDPRGVIVCLPDLLGSKEDLAPILPWLAKAGYTAVSLDHRGQYQSTSPGAFTMAELAADVDAVAQTFQPDPDSDAHLVGQGFGGLVAIETALADRTPWTSLTLLNAGTAGVGERPELVLIRELTGSGTELDVVFGKYRALVPATTTAEQEGFNRRRFLAFAPKALSAMTTSYTNLPDRLRELAETDLEIMLITGFADHTGGYQLLADRLGAQFRQFLDAGAELAAREPELIARAIARQCSCLH